MVLYDGNGHNDVTSVIIPDPRGIFTSSNVHALHSINVSHNNLLCALGNLGWRVVADYIDPQDTSNVRCVVRMELEYSGDYAPHAQAVEDLLRDNRD